MTEKVQKTGEEEWAVIDEAGNPVETGFDTPGDAKHYVETGERVDQDKTPDDVDEVLEDADEEDGYIAPNPDADDELEDDAVDEETTGGVAGGVAGA